MNINFYSNIYSTPNLFTAKSRNYNVKRNYITFGAFPNEVIKPMRDVYESGGSTLDKLFVTLPKEYQNRVIDIAKQFVQFGIDKNTIFKKVLTQPSMITSSAGLITERIKAHAFVERHKTGNSQEEIIPYVIDSKNLGKSTDSIYAILLISKIFKSHGRPKEFADESGIINALKRYCRRNPDVKFDKIEILDDEMSQSFIDFTKKLSTEITGNENLFDVSVKRELKPLNAPKPLSETKTPTVKETLSHLKYIFFEKFDNAEFLSLYKTLPENYHKNFSELLLLLRANKEKLSFYDLMPLFIRNNFFFNMKAPEALNLIKVKQFVDKSNGKAEVETKDIIKSAFFPAQQQKIYYSHFLASKMFPEKSKRPWYMKKAANADLTDGIRTFLRENPTVRYEFEVENTDKAESFYNYAKGLSRSSIGANAFKIAIKD